jgi:hypothetical protein
MLGRLVADLADGRALAESLMVDACVVVDPSTEVRVLDPDTDQYVVTTPAAVVYSGPCQVQDPSSGYGADREAGGADWTEQQRLVKVPAGSSAAALVRPGHVLRISACVFSAADVGRRFRIDGVGFRSLATSRRLRVTEMT